MMRFSFPILFLLSLLFCLALPAAAEDNLRPGVDYIELSPPRSVRVAADKIEIREFFNYSCPHCNRLQGHFSKWLAEHGGDDIVVVHQPVIFQRYNGHFARVYYTLQGLKLDKEFSPKVYDAIHTKRQLLNSRGRFLSWLEEEGVDYDKAEKMYDSFSVHSLTERADVIADDYGVQGTPQIAVNGKYIINPGLSRSYPGMMDILTILVERERNAR